MGTQETTRDFTFVSDTVNGFIKAARAKKDAEGQVFNLGTGKEISIGNLAKMIIQISGRDVKIVLDEKRLRPSKSEVSRLLSNNTKAREKLGWQPEVSLEEGIERTIRWIGEHMDLYSPDVYAF